MRLEVNGRPIETGAASLDELVGEFVERDVKVATALNGAFVAAGARAATPLKDGDRVEIVSPRQGG